MSTKLNSHQKKFNDTKIKFKQTCSVLYDADHMNPVSHMGDSSTFANYKVLIPVCLSIFAMTGFIAIVFIMRRRKLINQSRLTSSSMSDSPSTTNLQNKQNRDQQYHAVRCQSNRNSNSNDSGSYKAEGNGMNNLKQ